MFQIDVPVAKHVLHVFGDTDLGAKPRNLTKLLILTIRQALADTSPYGRDVLAQLEGEWPQHVAAVRAIARPWGVDPGPLRELVHEDGARLIETLDV